MQKKGANEAILGAEYRERKISIQNSELLPLQTHSRAKLTHTNTPDLLDLI